MRGFFKRLSGKPKQGKAAGFSKLSIGNLHNIGARDYQQDSFCLSDVSNEELCSRKGVLGVVADGMGGMADGAEISTIVTRVMLKYFNEVDSCGKTELDLLNMLHAANDNVNRFLKGRKQGGSTIVAVIIHNGELHWISVGDSRIYLVRGGAMLQLNREHVYSAELDEKAATGDITWESAAGDPQRTALTNYLGMGRLEKVDRNTSPLKLIAGDRIVLMCDGVYGTLSDDEIAATMHLPPPESAAEIERLILAKGKKNQDNLTAVIFECN